MMAGGDFLFPFIMEIKRPRKCFNSTSVVFAYYSKFVMGIVRYRSVMLC